MPNAIFYVYQWIREDDSPYYIGKGKGKRAWLKTKRHSPPKDKTRIQILAKNLYEHESFILEKKLIRLYGRKDIGTGILQNRTEGGDGVSGLIFSLEHRERIGRASKGNTHNIGRIHTQETKEKDRLASTGRILSEEACEKISISKLGKPRSTETCEKLKLANTGKTHSFEARTKMSISRTGKKQSNETKEKRKLTMKSLDSLKKRKLKKLEKLAKLELAKIEL